MIDLRLTGWYTEAGVSLTGIAGPTVGAGGPHLVYGLALLAPLQDVVADHQGHVGVAGSRVHVLSPATAWPGDKRLYRRTYWGRDLTYFICPGPGKYGEVLRGGLVGVVGDVRQVETVDLVVPVAHHFLHTGLPHFPVVLPLDFDQVLGVLEERDVCQDRMMRNTHLILHIIDQDFPDCLVLGAALGGPHLRQPGQL